MQFAPLSLQLLHSTGFLRPHLLLHVSSPLRRKHQLLMLLLQPGTDVRIAAHLVVPQTRPSTQCLLDVAVLQMASPPSQACLSTPGPLVVIVNFKTVFLEHLQRLLRWSLCSEGSSAECSSVCVLASSSAFSPSDPTVTARSNAKV